MFGDGDHLCRAHLIEEIGIGDFVDQLLFVDKAEVRSVQRIDVGAAFLPVRKESSHLIGQKKSQGIL